MMDKYYNLNIYKSYNEIKIIFMPKDDYNRKKLFYDLILYFEIDNFIIKHKNIIIIIKDELYNIILITNMFKNFILRLYKIIFKKFQSLLIYDSILFNDLMNIFFARNFENNIGS